MASENKVRILKKDRFWGNGANRLPDDDPRIDFVRGRQLHAYFATVPVVALGNLFNCFLVAAFAWGSVSTALISGWAGLISVLAIARLFTWQSYKKNPDAFDVEATLRKTMVRTSALGLLWAVCLGALFAVMDTADLVLVAIISAGMMSAGASTLSLLPKVAMIFCGTIAVGAIIGIFIGAGSISIMAAMLLGCFCMVLYNSISKSFSSFLTRSLQEYELSEQAETVKLLLNDYEEQSADWLWDVTAGGELSMITQRFAEAAARSREALEKLPLARLFEESPETSKLEQYIAELKSFRNLTVPLFVAGEPRWWSLSAKERRNDEGTEIIGLRGVATDVTVIKSAEARVAYMAHYDSLTDLPNRVFFNETLQRAMNRRADGRQVAMLCLDLDQFKSVNDTLGHPIGDALLKNVAGRISDCVPDGGMVARLGGDEFSLLLEDLDGPDDARAVAEKIIEAVSVPVLVNGHHILTTVSIGIAMVPDNGQSIDDIIKNSDLALYDAKENGRNQLSFFAASMDELARERRIIEMDLRCALGNDELSLHYQPLVNIKTGEVSGYEALMRWEHPEKGAIVPDIFIPVAEETGLIMQLGEWVIRNATAEAANWPEHLNISVNLSPVQMRSPNLISTVVSALASSGIAPERLELEITETFLMQDSEANMITLHKLHGLGIRIALDDFGTGYSSLNYLRSFPFDKIKIDKCFIEDIDVRDDCRAIVNSVVSLANQLGMTTTAEGVERSEQLDKLGLEGCTEAQGFLFSKAVPSCELTDLRSHTSKLAIIKNIAVMDNLKETAVDLKKRRKAG